MEQFLLEEAISAAYYMDTDRAIQLDNARTEARARNEARLEQLKAQRAQEG